MPEKPIPEVLRDRRKGSKNLDFREDATYTSVSNPLTPKQIHGRLERIEQKFLSALAELQSLKKQLL